MRGEKELVPTCLQQGLFDWNLKDQLKQKPGNRDLNFQLERSREYIREQAERVARKMESELKDPKAEQESSKPKNDWDYE